MGVEKDLLAFWIRDHEPVTQGSMIAVRGARRNAKMHMRHSNGKELDAWRKTIAFYAGYEMKVSGLTMQPKGVPIVVHADFFVRRGKKLKPHATGLRDGGDLDKLLRALFDALTGIVYVDDSQVVRVSASKTFSPNPGVRVRILTLP